MPGRVVQNNQFIYIETSSGLYCFDKSLPPLGEGAMGVVYSGQSVPRNKQEALNFTPERVAIKAVKYPFYNNPSIRQRAYLEADLMFIHPNVIRMLGCGEVTPNSGPIFIVSKYCDGENIDSYIRQKCSHLTPDERNREIIRLMIEMLGGLFYVHSFGIEHRDIKPSNIRVTSSGNAVLMDLGIARLNGGNKMSINGFVGTPQYAAPQQINREAVNSPFSPYGDIYSAGVSLYELITGYNPFDDPVDITVLERQFKLILPEHERMPKKLLPILRKATAKDQLARYGSAKEFSNALQDYLNGQTSGRNDKTGLIVTVALSSVAFLALIACLFIFLL